MPPGPKQQPRLCHPERPYYANGLCKSCYQYKYARTPKFRAGQRRTYLKHRTERIAHCQAWYRKNKPKVIVGIRELYHRYRQQVLEHYGSYCACCGEEEVLFLNIDHVKGDGKQHRAKHGNNQLNVFRSIIKAGFPADYRILCFNCNLGRQLNGGRCPHERQAINSNGDK